MLTEEQIKYPTGKFYMPLDYSDQNISQWINDINAFPKKLHSSVCDLPDEMLDNPYREGGWTIRQVVHHLADSHMNALLRFKWALTEENTVIKPYDQNKWSSLGDYALPVAPSLMLLDAVHRHWAVLLQRLDENQLNRTYTNSTTGDIMPLSKAIALYAWHGNHHLAHIQNTFKS